MIFAASLAVFFSRIIIYVFVVSVIINTRALVVANRTSCGLSGVIEADGTPSGVLLTTAWANDYRQVCKSTTVFVSSSNSSVGAQRVCGGISPAGKVAVDIGLLSRPFLPTEATTTDGYNYKCVNRGGKPRTAIQVEAAVNGAVLVVAPNGDADFCIKKLFGNGLTLEQLRILFSDYTPPTPLNVSGLSPTPSIPPSTSPVVPTTSPTVPITTIPPVPTSAAPTIKPTIKTKTAFPTLHAPILLVPIAPPTRKPTHRPTLPPKSLPKTWRINNSGKPTVCSRIPALIAGPPISSEVYQDFAMKILLDYAKGETISPNYNAINLWLSISRT